MTETDSNANSDSEWEQYDEKLIGIQLDPQRSEMLELGKIQNSPIKIKQPIKWISRGVRTSSFDHSKAYALTIQLTLFFDFFQF